MPGTSITMKLRVRFCQVFKSYAQIGKEMAVKQTIEFGFYFSNNCIHCGKSGNFEARL